MSASAQIAQELQELITTLQQERTINYVIVSAFSFLAYDMITMLSKEVELIWKAKWSIPFVLYIFTRYYGIIYIIIVFAVGTTPGDKLTVDVRYFSFMLSQVPSIDQRAVVYMCICRRYFLYYSLGGDIILTTVVNVILTLRIRAMYKQDIKVVCFMVVLVVVEFVVELYVSLTTAIRTSNTAYLSPPGVPLSGCLTSSPSKGLTLMSWITCLVIAAIMFFMTLVKVLRAGWMLTPHSGSTFSLSELTFRDSISPLLTSLLKDGTIHFFFITVILVVCTITVNVINGPYEAIGLEWLITIYSTSGSRLILNLREKAFKDDQSEPGSSFALQTMNARGPISFTTSGSETATRFTSVTLQGYD